MQDWTATTSLKLQRKEAQKDHISKNQQIKQEISLERT